MLEPLEERALLDAVGLLEIEPNDSLVNAGALTVAEDPASSGYHVGYLVAHGLGSIDPTSDEDWWSFEALAGDRVALALDTPESELRTSLYIYGESGNYLTRDYGGSAGPGYDAYISHYVIPEDGTYYARVDYYTGTVGNYQLRLDVARGIDLESDANYANDSISGADPLTLTTVDTHRDGSIAGTIMAGESGNVDEDYYSLGVVEAGETILARVTLPESSSLLPVTEIRDSNNQVISVNPNPTDQTVSRVDIWETSTYYVVIVALDGSGHFGQYLLDTTIAPTAELLFADLSVSEMVAPSEASSGETVHFEWTVGNYGTAVTDSDVWYDRVILSSNEIYGDDDDIHLGSISHNGFLGPNESYTAQADIQLPPEISGSYHLFVKTDATNRVFEFNLEDNNVREAATPITVALTPYADLKTDTVLQ